MKQKVLKTGQLLDDLIRKVCERIPHKKRKIVVLSFSFLFITVFVISLWNSFHNQNNQKVFEMEHIEPLELPNDTLNHKLKNSIHE